MRWPPTTTGWRTLEMGYGPGFGLPDSTSATSEVRKAVADLTALPSDPVRDGQLVMMQTMLEGRLVDEAAGWPTGPFEAPATSTQDE